MPITCEIVHGKINIKCLYISMFKMACVWLSPLIYSSLNLKYPLNNFNGYHHNSYHRCETAVNLRFAPPVSGGVAVEKWMIASRNMKLQFFQIYPLVIWNDSFIMLAQSLVSSEERTCQNRGWYERLSTFKHWLPCFSSKLEPKQALSSSDFDTQAGYPCSQLNLWNTTSNIIAVIIKCY